MHTNYIHLYSNYIHSLKLSKNTLHNFLINYENFRIFFKISEMAVVASYTDGAISSLDNCFKILDYDIMKNFII